MKSDLSLEQIAAYQENGFLVIDEFLVEDELLEWRTIVDAAVDQRLQTTRQSGDLDDPTFYTNVFTQCLRLADTSSEIARLVHDQRLGKMSSELAGAGAMRIWHDQALIKGPYSNPTSWHNDVPYWSFASSRSVNMWFALDDASIANGCLWYMPGTHKSARHELVPIGESFEGLLRNHPEWRKLDAVAAPCRAGSLVIHNGLIAHAAGPNITSRPRRAMTSAYFPDGEVYNGRRDTLAHYTDGLQVGDPLNDERYVPLVWR